MSRLRWAMAAVACAGLLGVLVAACDFGTGASDAGIGGASCACSAAPGRAEPTFTCQAAGLASEARICEAQGGIVVQCGLAGSAKETFSSPETTCTAASFCISLDGLQCDTPCTCTP